MTCTPNQRSACSTHRRLNSWVSWSPTLASPWTQPRPTQSAFKMLKVAFTQAPILAHFNPDNPIVVETDASDYAIAAIISQISPDNDDIHLIAFYSHNMQPVELNYEIYNKEFLAIFGPSDNGATTSRALHMSYFVLSNNKNLKYFTTTKQ